MTAHLIIGLICHHAVLTELNYLGFQQGKWSYNRGCKSAGLVMQYYAYAVLPKIELVSSWAEHSQAGICVWSEAHFCMLRACLLCKSSTMHVPTHRVFHQLTAFTSAATMPGVCRCGTGGFCLHRTEDNL